ncbi:hypothetical protein [Mucilaginibacter ginsenosidivorax]|uniref:Uncharacterized protein n=1 Tax=Mucilaginibacter ginsenosidivorax TaxID=862126 RepID=A0A5B8W6H6_9SPHI|nr:hypothetical protein [Mucilaginibacter ginsenosidivorax]QEC79057.1 hypothetical protein FSB76_25040 [Mucilaginibacter ginsenosidivorax]
MPEFNTIVLHGQVDMTNATIKNSLKEMKSGDTVLVSGSFVKSGFEKIDFSDYNDDFRHPFSSPEFKFNFDSIVKKRK